MRKHMSRSVFLIVVMSIFMTCFCGAAYGKAVKKVAVCPFQMNASQDLTFLQKGLFSMMSSRLSDPGKVEVLSREAIDEALDKAQGSAETSGELNPDKARVIGRSIGVDYMLYGSVTMFGKSISLDTTMVDVNSDKPPLTFSRQAGEPGAVITELDLIASQINLKTFNRRAEQFVPPAQVAGPQYQAQQVVKVEPGSGNLVNHRIMLSTRGEVTAIAAADVDGDGQVEIVAVMMNDIRIYKDSGQQGLLALAGKISDGSHMDIVGLDAADINANGKAEIFVTRVLRQSGQVRSMVLEFDGSGYKKIVDDFPWYLRVIRDTFEKPTLFGQRTRGEGPYGEGTVAAMTWEGTSYSASTRIKVPGNFSVLTLAIQDMNDIVASPKLCIDADGRLKLFTSSGKLDWVSEAEYGGTTQYYTFKNRDATTRELANNTQVYFQTRSIMFEVPKTGVKKVFVIRNEESNDNLFARMRRIKRGVVEVMTWEGVGVNPDPMPKGIPGQITDMAILKVPGSARKMLLISYIKKSDNLSAKQSRSMIVAYDM